MRIGIDASNLRRVGGLTHLTELLGALDPAEHGIREVVVWAGRKTLERIAPRNWLCLVDPAGLDRSAAARLEWQRAGLSRAAKERCDVLFIPGGMYTGSFRPFVTMSRNLLPFDPLERRRFGLSPTRLRYHALEWLQARTFRKAAGVVFLTEAARRAVLLRTGELQGATVVIPHGVSSVFQHEPRRAKPLSGYGNDAPFRWLYVSIVNLYKHQWHVAEAAALLRKRGYPVMLDLVGPSYPPALKRLQHTLDRVDPNGTFVQYHGPLPYEALCEQYEQADAFVFASSCETFGQILVEAMQSGLPIACANRSAMPELLQEAGVYFDPEDVASIASAMRRLMEDPALREHSARAAYQRAQAFSWNRCARTTFSFIADIGRQQHMPSVEAVSVLS